MEFVKLGGFGLVLSQNELISRPLVYRVPTGRLYMVLLAHFMSKMCALANESIG